jgi:hypothetical protein
MWTEIDEKLWRVMLKADHFSGKKTRHNSTKFRKVKPKPLSKWLPLRSYSGDTPA